MLNRYFNWLQKDNPVGLVERYPALSEDGETTLKGVYVAGDLTGVPLLSLAADGGAKLVERLIPKISSAQGEGVYDIVIIGAGPAGISAAMQCAEKNIKYTVLESGRSFNTIENFPKGKPILIRPNDFQSSSALQMQDGSKETLLDQMKSQISSLELDIQEGVVVQHLRRKKSSLGNDHGGGIGDDNGNDHGGGIGDLIEIEDHKGHKLKAQYVILAIGKSGNSRSLGVPGEKLEKVYNRLYDPADHGGKKVAVIGGGDSALETSIALCQHGAEVSHIYRQASFSRAKEENVAAMEALAREGRLNLHMQSDPVEIKANEVLIKTPEGQKTLENHTVFAMIGRELPLAFFKRCGIRMEGEKDWGSTVYMVAMISFFSMLYFGKSGWAFPAKDHGWLGFLMAPAYAPLSFGLKDHAWYASINFVLGWLGAIVFLISGPMSLYEVIKKRDHYFGSTWLKIKTGYLGFVAVVFTGVYFKSIFMAHGDQSWVEAPTYWYSLFYCSTMALFGWRRAQVKKTLYVKRQMITLVFIQTFFLFLLPFHLYDPIASLFPQDHWIMAELFPWGKWTCFSFILFWPLSCWQFGTSTFWTIFPFIQTGLFLYWIVKEYGKGAYCGWICSCGGMAETLGDEYRSLAPHGPKAKSLENLGQFVLAFAFVVTALSYMSHQEILPKGVWLDTLKGSYKFSIDVFFAGVLGLGVYFFMGGRVWCRFGCPLAALMHIYTRFSKYRILSEKKSCISCNICTKVCHMGIDVMNYANKGIPMNDVECVRCSTCVTSCPMEVLSFEKMMESDPDNKARPSVPDYGKDDWRAGIK